MAVAVAGARAGRGPWISSPGRWERNAGAGGQQTSSFRRILRSESERPERPEALGCVLEALQLSAKWHQARPEKRTEQRRYTDAFSLEKSLTPERVV